MRTFLIFFSLLLCLAVSQAGAQSLGAFGDNPPPPPRTVDFGSGTSLGGHINPIAHETRRLTSPFGMRSGRLHAGVDMAACRTADGHPAPDIIASKGGTVMFSGTVSGYGNVVDVLHGSGVRTRYAHLARRSVRVGQTINQGQKVGVMGASGGNYAVHLHYETHTSVNSGGPFNVARKGGAGVEQNPCGYLPDCRQMQTTQASYNDAGCGMPFDTLPWEDYDPHEYMVDLDTDFDHLDYAETMIWDDEDYKHEAQFSDETCKYKLGGIFPITIDLPACEVSFTYVEPVVQLESVSSPSFSNLVNGLPTPESRVFEMLDEKYGTDWRGSSSAYLNQKQSGMAYYYTRVFGVTPKARFDSSGTEDQVKKSLSCDIAEYAWDTWEDMVNATAVTQALNMAETLAAIASGDPMAALQAAASNPQIQIAASNIAVGPFSLNDFMQMDPEDLQGSLKNMAKDYVSKAYPEYAGYANQLANMKNLSPAEMKNLAVDLGKEAARQQKFNIGGVEMNLLEAGNLLKAPRADKINFLRNTDIPGTNISIGNAYETLRDPSSLSVDDVKSQAAQLSNKALADAGYPVDVTQLNNPSTWRQEGRELLAAAAGKQTFNVGGMNVGVDLQEVIGGQKDGLVRNALNSTVDINGSFNIAGTNIPVNGSSRVGDLRGSLTQAREQAQAAITRGRSTVSRFTSGTSGLDEATQTANLENLANLSDADIAAMDRNQLIETIATHANSASGAATSASGERINLQSMAGGSDTITLQNYVLSTVSSSDNVITLAGQSMPASWLRDLPNTQEAQNTVNNVFNFASLEANTQAGVNAVDTNSWLPGASQNTEQLRSQITGQLTGALNGLSGGQNSTNDILNALSGRDSSASSSVIDNLTTGVLDKSAPGAVQELGLLDNLQNTSVFNLDNMDKFQASAAAYFGNLTDSIKGFPAEIGGKIADIKTSVTDIFTQGPEGLKDAFISGQFTDSLMNPAVMSALGLDPEMAQQLQTAMEAAQAVRDLQQLASTFGDIGSLSDLSQLSEMGQMANPVMMYIKAAQEINKLAGMFNLTPTPEVKLDPTSKSSLINQLNYAVSVWFPNADLYGGATDLMAVYLAEHDDTWYDNPTRWESRSDLLERCPAYGSGGGHEGGAIGGIASAPSATTEPLSDPYCISGWGTIEPTTMFTAKSGNSLIDMSLLSYKAFRRSVVEERIVSTKVPEKELALDYRETDINLEYPYNVDIRSKVGTDPAAWGVQEGVMNQFTNSVDDYLSGLRDAALRQQATQSIQKRDGNVNTLYKTTTCKVVTCCDVYPGFEPKHPWKVKTVNEFK